jgi:hypothetical protein
MHEPTSSGADTNGRPGADRPGRGRRPLNPIRIAVVIGAALIVLGSAAITMAHGGLGFAGGDGRGGSVVGPITITAIDGSNVALQTADGWTRTIAVTGTVTITRGTATIALADLRVGDEVRLSQTRNEDGTYTVTAIRVVQPSVVGTVTAKDGTALTILERDGSTTTVTTSSSTTYRIPGIDEPGLDDITVGMVIVAVGDRADNGSLTASTIGASFWGRGFRGFHGDGDRNATPNASPSPSTTESSIS